MQKEHCRRQGSSLLNQLIYNKDVDIELITVTSAPTDIKNQ